MNWYDASCRRNLHRAAHPVWKDLCDLLRRPQGLIEPSSHVVSLQQTLSKDWQCAGLVGSHFLIMEGSDSVVVARDPLETLHEAQALHDCEKVDWDPIPHPRAAP